MAYKKRRTRKYKKSKRRRQYGGKYLKGGKRRRKTRKSKRRNQKGGCGCSGKSKKLLNLMIYTLISLLK